MILKILSSSSISSVNLFEGENFVSSNISINLDLNCMQYDKGVGLYLSIMTKCTKIKKEELDIKKLKELVDNVEGNLLVDNSDKGIIIMIDFAMESIIEE